MGGFGSMLGGLFDKASSGIVEKELSTEAGKALWHYSGNMEELSKVHPAAMEIMGKMKDFTYSYESQYAKLHAPVQKLWDEVGKTPIPGNPNLRTTNVGDLHDALLKSNHPASKYTGDILQQNVQPKTGKLLNEDKTLDLMKVQNAAQASLAARTKAFGKNLELVVPHFEELATSPDPNINDLGNLLRDSVSNMTHDRISSRVGSDKSAFKVDLNTAFSKINKLRQKIDPSSPQIPLGDTNPTYTKTSSAERTARGIITTRLADAAVIPHATTIITNLVANTPPSYIVKGLQGMSDPEFLKFEAASGVLAHVQQSMWDAAFDGATGKVAKITGSKTAGQLLYSSTHLPLFNVTRRFQLHLAASVGYNAAIDWASQVAKGGRSAARAAAELVQMRLDPKAIAARGGKLTDEELTQAMFHFANDRFSINRPMDRSLAANSNVFMRSATMFHQFVNFQQKFLFRELNKMLKANDYVGLAQFVGTMGLLMPAIAPLIKSAETLARTASASQAVQGAKEDYQGLTSPKDAGDFMSHYIEMLSYIGPYGTWRQMLLGAKGKRLLGTAMGPMFNIPATLATDTYAAAQASKAGKHNLKPLERDVLNLSVPVVGKWAAHQLVPTETSTPKRAPRAMRIRKGKSNERTIGEFEY